MFKVCIKLISKLVSHLQIRPAFITAHETLETEVVESLDTGTFFNDGSHFPNEDSLTRLAQFLSEAGVNKVLTDNNLHESSESEPSYQKHHCFADLSLLNTKEVFNSYFTGINRQLATAQHFLFRLETKRSRARCKFNGKPNIIRYPHQLFDFTLHRIAPKINPTRRLYQRLYRNRYKVISLPESMARAISCGFEIVDHITIDQDTFVLTRKSTEPLKVENPSYGLIIRLPRVGRNGSQIGVYKIRTMYPYSEYLQEYVFDRNGTLDGDKIEDDFRIARWGRFMRKNWIDEIPMLWNWLKGDLKLVGVRPLSMHKYSTYPKDLQIDRIRFKPGMIPPFYAALPETPEDFFEAEREYIRAYEKNPWRTDIRYFWKAFYNIIIKGERSR